MKLIFNKLKVLMVCGLSVLALGFLTPAVSFAAGTPASNPSSPSSQSQTTTNSQTTTDPCGSSVQAAVQCGTNGANGGNSQSPASASKSFDKIIKEILNLLSITVGIIAVVMIIIAGARFITSAGNAEGVKSSKNALMYAIIGLIIAALAQLVVKFVLNKVTNA